MALAAGDRLGTYEILGPLGAGGMGEVYRARDSRLGRDVAIKVLPADVAADPERLARFEREARMVAALNHPGIVTLYSIEEAGPVRFLAMELIEGQSLDRLVAPGGLPVGRVLEIALPLVDALVTAHGRGVVHRDLKPANVMMTYEGRVKVLDFGLAKLAIAPSAATAETLAPSQLETAAAPLTSMGLVVGTAGYMAPEQIRGETVDARTDLFAVGVILYELASGRRPFSGGTLADVSVSILRDAPDPLRGAPADFQRIVSRCLEKRPEDRYASANDLLHDLHAIARALEQGLPLTEVSPRTPAPAAATAARRGSALALWLSLAAIALIAAGIWLQRSRHTSAPARTSEQLCVAVLEFENVTGDPSLDWMKRGVPELLSSALVQSPALDVFDAQRMGDLAGAEHLAWPPPTATYEFLAKHRISRAIVGNILRSGGELRVEGRIVDTNGGRPVHSYAVEGPADSGLFKVTGRLVANLQVALEVNLMGNRDAEGWLREITTDSPDAYRLYLKGHEALLAEHWKEAAAAYEQALGIDSTFVAARSELAGAYWNLGEEAKLQLTRAAMHRLRGRADHRGQLRIDLLDAVVSGNPPQLITAAAELSRLYPENRFYTYLLGRGYFTSQQYQRCIDTLRPLVEQRYEWAWTYVLTARSHEHLGDAAAARRAYQLGFEISHADPELSYMYVGFLRTRGEFDRARVVIDQALESPTLSETPTGEGELRTERARDLLRRGDGAGAREELRRADPLLPRGDEARADLDSMLKVVGPAKPR
ncbi:MAG: protein kinase domain-containing protein [Candidatus Eiseniibacteriota bacterium]